MVAIYCDECGAAMKKVGDIKNTREFVCEECFAKKVQYIADKPCKHEYDDKNGDKCIHCGKPNFK